MDQWFVPPEMLALANTQVNQFGYDQTKLVQYQFNQHGFRSPEFVTDRSIFFFGNSITFGIGLSQIDSFAELLSTTLGLPFGNLSLGCFYHENHDNLSNLTNLTTRDQDDLFVIQINNLDRRRVSSEVVILNNDKKYCEQKFLNYFDLVNTMLKGRRRLFLYWDTDEYDLPKSVQKELLIHNKFHLDRSLSNNASTFGSISHKAIAKVLLAKIS